MVARSTPASTAKPGFTSRWFLAWRRLLTRGGRGCAAAASGTASAAHEATRRAVSATREGARDVRDAVVESGHAALRAPKQAAEDVADSVGWLFGGWRRVLGRMIRRLALGQRLSHAGAIARDTYLFLRRPASLADLEAHAIDDIAALGVRAALVGTTVAFVVGWLTSGAAAISLARAAGALAWAVARLAILVMLAPKGREPRLRAYAAWAVSLLPFGLGITEGLRFLALASSAWLCLEALKALGEQPHSARTMVLWAFGGQAGIIAVGWVLRGGVAAMSVLF